MQVYVRKAGARDRPDGGGGPWPRGTLQDGDSSKKLDAKIWRRKSSCREGQSVPVPAEAG